MRGCLLSAFALSVAAGCSSQHNQQAARAAWVAEQAAKHPLDALRLEASGTSEVDYFEGWYPVESDAEAGRVWRWMGKRGLVRLRFSPGGDPPGPVSLSVHGWVLSEQLGPAAAQLTFFVNGHELDRYEAPKERFVYSLNVPAALLDADGRIELAIVAANTVRPKGDERDLGFASSGFTWTKANQPR